MKKAKIVMDVRLLRMGNTPNQGETDKKVGYMSTFIDRDRYSPQYWGRARETYIYKYIRHKGGGSPSVYISHATGSPKKLEHKALFLRGRNVMQTGSERFPLQDSGVCNLRSY